MNSGLYGACAGLMARTKALDTIAANVANSSSAGFRGEENVFGTVLAEAGRHGRMSALNKATNSFSQIGDSQMDATQGVITRTGNDLDLAIEGSGYFKVKSATGSAYTRNGHFHADANGRLVTDAGEPVIGDDGGEIRLTKGKISISANGTISCDGVISGKLSLVTFLPGTKLINHGASQYGAPAGSELPASQSSLQQGALEGSNVSPMEGVVQLITAQRAAESMRHALTLIDGEMDKATVQDLARVNQ
jgi:flagellar basal-body rod protein FlgF/flagellar basal-body rod protein FlgG